MLAWEILQGKEGRRASAGGGQMMKRKRGENTTRCSMAMSGRGKEKRKKRTVLWKRKKQSEGRSSQRGVTLKAADFMEAGGRCQEIGSGEKTNAGGEEEASRTVPLSKVGDRARLGRRKQCERGQDGASLRWRRGGKEINDEVKTDG